jgi:hypothetical protein
VVTGSRPAEAPSQTQAASVPETLVVLQPESPVEKAHQDDSAAGDVFESQSTDDEISPSRRVLSRRASTQVGHVAHVMEVDVAAAQFVQVIQLVSLPPLSPVARLQH